VIELTNELSAKSPSSFCLTPATIFENSELNTHHTSTQSIDEQLALCLRNLDIGQMKPPRADPHRRSIGRIKGIELYIGRWSVTFQGMTPTVMRPKRLSRNRRRLSCTQRKKLNSSTESYTFSIYKDGSVHVLPKTAFGWNGVGTIIADTENQRVTIHSADHASDEFEKMSMSSEGTLLIEHFVSSIDESPIMGSGVLAHYI